MKKSLKLIISLALPLLLGFMSSLFMDLTWYDTLNKPIIAPPNWIFAPVWTTLYILMGLAFYLVWIKDPASDYPYLIYFAQLILNFLWTAIFFGLQLPTVAFFEIIILLILTIATIFEFYKIDKKAAYLLIPYVLWIAFATVLNYSFILANI